MTRQLQNTTGEFDRIVRELTVVAVRGEKAIRRSVELINEYQEKFGKSRKKLVELATAVGVEVTTLYRWKKQVENPPKPKEKVVKQVSFIELPAATRLRIVPLTLAQANDFVSRIHRHHAPCIGHRFSVGVADENGNLRGVAIVGRAVARHVDQNNVLEVSRLATDGTTNACSILYGTCARVAKEMGFSKIQTYILESEPGTSLKASGWVNEGEAGGGEGWHSRDGRRDDQPTERKQRWAKVFEPKFFEVTKTERAA